MLPSVVPVWSPSIHMVTPTHGPLQLQGICHHLLAFLASGPQYKDLQVRSCIRVAGTLNCSVFSPTPERYSFKAIKLQFLFTPSFLLGMQCAQEASCSNPDSSLLWCKLKIYGLKSWISQRKQHQMLFMTVRMGTMISTSLSHYSTQLKEYTTILTFNPLT